MTAFVVGWCTSILTAIPFIAVKIVKRAFRSAISISVD